MRRLALVVGAAVLAAAPVAAGQGALSAAAHDQLIASSPEDSATVAQAPDVVELTFDNAVQSRFAQVAVLDADDQPHQEGEPEVVGPTVTQALGDLPDGEYTVSYRVVSSDGHPVSGTITFTVEGSGAADPTADPSIEAPAETTPETPEQQSPDDTAPTSEPTVPPADDADTGASGDADGGGPSTAVIILVIVGAAVVVGGIAYLLVGGRGGGSTEDTGA